MITLLDILFDRFTWYRKWRKGHWELWWNDATQSLVWIRLDKCSKKTLQRPSGCMGTPVCEHYN